MFICEITGRHSQPGDKCHKIVVATRERNYTRWVRNEETNKWEEVFVAKGWEIVKEINATQSGMQTWEGLNEEARAALLKVDVRDRIHLELGS